MSAEYVILFYGTRTEISADRIESYDRTHPDIKRARKHGLQWYAGNFASPDERYYLFIGQRLGLLGAEESNEIALDTIDLREVFDSVQEKLASGGFEGVAQLFAQRAPDA